MKTLKGIANTIDKINNSIGIAVSYSVLIILGVITYEVISRRFLNAPTIWAYEVITMSFAIYVILISAYGLQKGSFVCVDIFSSKFTEYKKHIFRIVCYVIFFFPFIGGIFPKSITFFINSILSNEKSWSQWAPTIWPVKLALAIGLFLLLLQGISEVIKSIVWIIEHKKLNKVDRR